MPQTELTRSIPLKKIVEAHDLKIVHRSADYENVRVNTFHVSRPSLQLVGFYDYFDADRIRLWGRTENAFLDTLTPERRREIMEALFSKKIPVLILCSDVEAKPAVLAAAEKYDVTVLRTEVDTSELVAQMLDTLRSALSPRITTHAVLVQVFGEGLLITGDSGIGKSEVALELIKRGHRLVADDAVEIRRMGHTSLVGSAPKLIRYLMELRGVGLIDVRRLFGVGAVIPRCHIDLVVNFETWVEGKVYDRLGLEEHYTDILDVQVPIITVPVAPARNLAIILEVAAMNHREKELGHNTALEFLKMHDRIIDSGGEPLTDE